MHAFMLLQAVLHENTSSVSAVIRSACFAPYRASSRYWVQRVSVTEVPARKLALHVVPS